ncbi:hypothetical protein Hanom_Chr04g00342861 [Helianthus anomalus]
MDSSNSFYTYAMYLKTCVLANAFALNFIFNMLQVDDDAHGESSRDDLETHWKYFEYFYYVKLCCICLLML